VVIPVMIVTTPLFLYKHLELRVLNNNRPEYAVVNFYDAITVY